MDYLQRLPSELSQIALATLQAKRELDAHYDFRGHPEAVGLGHLAKVYDHIITASTLACLLFRDHPLELLNQEVSDVKQAGI